MRNVFWLSSMVISLGILLFSFSPEKRADIPSAIVQARPEETIQYISHPLESSVVHSLRIPASSSFLVTPALSQELSPLESFAQKHQALAAINGGFFDPQNQKSTSYIVQQGQLVADPRLNERLMNNPNLTLYLNKILDRTEWRRYQCGTTVDYDIALHSEPTPEGCQLVDALGGGPRLLPELTSLAEGFVDISNGEVIRDAIGSHSPNARSAVGITAEGDILLVMVAQKPEAPTTSGMSLTELADFLKSQGVEEAMNLDGGSSSSLYYNGQTVYGKVENQGNRIKRSIKSVLLVR